jgi:hypothetical protein
MAPTAPLIASKLLAEFAEAPSFFYFSALQDGVEVSIGAWVVHLSHLVFSATFLVSEFFWCLLTKIS